MLFSRDENKEIEESVETHDNTERAAKTSLSSSRLPELRSVDNQELSRAGRSSGEPRFSPWAVQDHFFFAGKYFFSIDATTT